MWLIVDLSLRKNVFGSVPFRVRSMVDRASQGQVFVRLLRFPLVSSLHQLSVCVTDAILFQ